MDRISSPETQFAYVRLHEISKLLKRCLAVLGAYGIQNELSKLGIKTLDPNALAQLIPTGHVQDLNPILKQWRSEIDRELKPHQDLFLFLGLMKLWSEWFSNRPCEVVLLMRLDDGYDFLEMGETSFALEAWTCLFHAIELHGKTFGIDSHELELWFDHYQILSAQAGAEPENQKRILSVKNNLGLPGLNKITH